MFGRYEEDYSSLVASLGDKLGSLTKETGEARRAAVVQFERELAEAQDLIKSMEIEARGVAPAEKSKLQARVKSYKSDAAALKTRLRDASTAVSRDDLGLSGTSDGESDSQRSRLLEGTQRVESKMKAGTDKLKEAQRSIAETETVGASILGDLRQQRETIVRSSASLRGVSGQLERSGRKLREMGRRALANKLIMYVMIGLLAAGCFFLVYVQTIGGASPPAAQPEPSTKGRRLLFAPSRRCQGCPE